MTTVNINQAKTNFSKLVNAVMHGEEIIIAKAGIPAAKLVPITPVNLLIPPNSSNYGVSFLRPT